MSNFLSTGGYSVNYPPILDAETEHSLAVEFYEHKNVKAAQKLILSHLRFVSYVVYGYRGYGLDSV